MYRRRTVLVVFLLCIIPVVHGQNLPDSVLQLLEKNPKDSIYIDSLNNLAFSYLKSKPEIGRVIAERSTAIARNANYTKGYSRALNITGSSYWVVGNYESALDYYLLSARESGAVADSIGLSRAYHNIGEVYKKLGDYERSIEYLNLSIQFDSDRKNYPLTTFNIGEAHYFLGNYSSALDYFERALSYSVKENDLKTLAYSYTGLGLIKHKNKEYYEALAYYTKAEALWREQGEIRAIVQTYQDFHDSYLELNQMKSALDYIDKAIAMADGIDAADLQINNYLRKTEYFKRMGNYENALDLLTRHNNLRDSLYSEKRSEQIARLQTLFDTEARDIENQKLKTTQALLDAQIRTQNLLLTTISGGLLATGLLAYFFFYQRKKIADVNNLLIEKNAQINRQKEEIEQQTQELKNLNDQLQDLNKSLESKIEERTKQLTWQNKKLAEYAHTNAHQLRAPIASILGLLGLIGRIQLPQEDKVLIEHLNKCGRELDQITREISRNLEEEDRQAK